VSKRIRSICEV